MNVSWRRFHCWTWREELSFLPFPYTLCRQPLPSRFLLWKAWKTAFPAERNALGFARLSPLLGYCNLRFETSELGVQRGMFIPRNFLQYSKYLVSCGSGTSPSRAMKRYCLAHLRCSTWHLRDKNGKGWEICSHWKVLKVCPGQRSTEVMSLVQNHWDLESLEWREKIGPGSISTRHSQASMQTVVPC